jgi:hypothetical protein
MKTQRNLHQTKITAFTRTLWAAAVTLVLASTLMSAPPAFTQTIAGGTVELTGPSGGLFTLTGGGPTVSGFTVTGGFYVPLNYIYVFCNPCGPQLDIEVRASGLDLTGGNAYTWVPTRVFPIINWGPLNPGGPSYLNITGPAIPLNHGPGAYTGSFTYTAALCGEVNGLLPPCDVAVPPQAGSGQVIVYIAKNQQFGWLYTTKVTYLFQ